MTRTQALVSTAMALTPNKSARQLARRLGVTTQAVLAWKNGHTRPGLYACAKLAEFLGKPLQEVAAVITGDHHMQILKRQQDLFVCTRPGGCEFARRTRKPAKMGLAR